MTPIDDRVWDALDDLAGYAPVAARMLEAHLQGRGGLTGAECAAMLDTPAARRITLMSMATLHVALLGDAT